MLAKHRVEPVPDAYMFRHRLLSANTTPLGLDNTNRAFDYFQVSKIRFSRST